jgi:hypothetical protein
VSGPFIFIATNRLKPGKLADERKRVSGLVDFVDANEPRLIAFNVSLCRLLARPVLPQPLRLRYPPTVPRCL